MAIRERDRETAVVATSILVAACVIQKGMGVLMEPSTFVQCAGAASSLIAATDKHLAPKRRGK